jgi:hypothetical protein
MVKPYCVGNNRIGEIIKLLTIQPEDHRDLEDTDNRK